MGVLDVLNEIRQAEAFAGRKTGSVRLAAVTKGRTVQEINKILHSGVNELAENKGQELRDKKISLPGISWHFIGALQRNKIKYLEGVALVHTIEEIWQAEEIAGAANKWGKAPKLLIQVHNGEEQKHGMPKERLATNLKTIKEIGLDVCGLMVMAPYDRPDLAKEIFLDTRSRAHDLGLQELSMGMSDDFHIAIEAGATIVRIGSKLFS